jgi:hypothetical protein
MLRKIILLTALLTSIAANAATSNSSPVPEPESLSLILLGIAIMGLIVFRQK